MREVYKTEEDEGIIAKSIRQIMAERTGCFRKHSGEIRAYDVIDAFLSFALARTTHLFSFYAIHLPSRPGRIMKRSSFRAYLSLLN